MIELRDFTIKGKRGFQLRIEEMKIRNGQFIQIFGNNRCGKTLLLRTLCGDYQGWEGKIYYNGIDVKPGGYKSFFIPSECVLLPERTVKENLFLPFKSIAKQKRSELLDLIKSCGLSHSLPHKAETLSRSEGKTLELVRAVVQSPHYLMIDDFDISFDSHSLNQISPVFEYAAKKGTTIIVTAKAKISYILTSYILNGGVLQKL